MRYAVVITGYKNNSRKVENFISQSIQEADDVNEAVEKGCRNEGVVSKLLEGYKLFWKKAIEVPEIDNQGNNVVK